MNKPKNYRTCKLIKGQIDEILHQMAVLFANLGEDSTIEEVQDAYRKENELIDRIVALDPEKGQSIRPYAN